MRWMSDPTLEPKLSHTKEEMQGGPESDLHSHDPFNGRDLSQFHFLNHIMDRLTILHVENLAEEFARLPFVGEFSDLPHATPDPDYNWRDYITNTAEPLIYEWAQRDFDAFGYKRYDLL